MMKRKNYIFTNRKHSNRAIMAVILGIISIATMWAVVFSAYKTGGESTVGYGIAGVFALLFSVIGMIFGVITYRNKNYYSLFPVLAMLLNALSIAGICLILYAGANL